MLQDSEATDYDTRGRLRRRVLLRVSLFVLATIVVATVRLTLGRDGPGRWAQRETSAETEGGILTLGSTRFPRPQPSTPARPLRYLLDKADIVVRGVVRRAADDGAPLWLDVAEFLRGGTPFDDGLRFTRRLSCHGASEWPLDREVILFLRPSVRTGEDDVLVVVGGDVGVQTLPIDGWVTLPLLAACVDGPSGVLAAREHVTTLVQERGIAILGGLREIAWADDLVDQAQAMTALRGALDALLDESHASDWPHAAANLSTALQLASKEAALPTAELHAVQPILASHALEAGVDPLAIVRATLHADREWSRQTLTAWVDQCARRIESTRPDRLTSANQEAFALLGAIDPDAAKERTQALLRTVPPHAVRRDLFGLSLQYDHEFALRSILRNAWSDNQLRTEYAALLVEVDDAEARMLLRSSLIQLADDSRSHAAFFDALSQPGAAEMRASLATAFVEEAERFDNVTYPRQAFLLRGHLECGGTLESFAGWLPKLLGTPAADAADDAERLAMLRLLDTELGTHTLRWKRPPPAELDAATQTIRERLLE